jgi:sec-independent protein translocase protein TatC
MQRPRPPSKIMASRKPDYTPQQEQPFMSHLIELRARLLRMVVFILAVFAALFPFTSRLYALLAQPLLQRLPAGGSMIATEVASPFLTPFKFVFVLAIALSMPYILHQVWRFIAPGLYRREKRIALPLLISSIILFYSGIAFAYFLVFPLAFRFLVGTAPEGVSVMTDISKYLDFALTIFFAFGLSFEVPVAIILLVWAGITTPAALAAKRSYVIVGAFVVGAVLTPPDVLSQTLLAVPMWLLFELGLLFSRFIVASQQSQEAASTAVKRVGNENRPPS